jgi:hypothetical protein
MAGSDLRRAQSDVLPPIPYVDLGRADPVALADVAIEQWRAVVAESHRHYGWLTLRAGDRATRRWLARNGNPYLHEIDAVSARTTLPGAFLLNLSFEWSCTAGVGRDPGGAGSRLLRTLDWPVTGLGRSVVVARRETDAGTYVNVTWPGFVGVLTAMAPGRFAAAINQPPLRRVSGSAWFDWAIARTGLWRRSALPPAHLLRRVFDTCRTYAEARAALIGEPLCVPAFFTLAGAGGDGCVIERLENEARVHEAPATIANHWLALDQPGHDRGTDSIGRRALLGRSLETVEDGLSWVEPPIRNARTRLAAVAHPGRGQLLVQGWEAEGPVTAIFNLRERLAGETRRTTRARPAAATA